MRYKNAKDILPPDVLALIQQYTDGEYIYVPRVAKSRKSWGSSTDAKTQTLERNKEIYSKYRNGRKAGELAYEYYLSEKSIQRIITLGNKGLYM